MKLGFTGTQSGMTDGQKSAFIKLIGRLKPTEFHHGDCVGSDAEAHDLIRTYYPDCKIIGHIPLKDYKRAFKKCDEERPPKNYLERNEDIARECKLVIAAPKEMTETVRSGTWATIRRARKVKTSIIIIWPNGACEKETFPSAEGAGLPTEDVTNE